MLRKTRLSALETEAAGGFFHAVLLCSALLVMTPALARAADPGGVTKSTNREQTEKAALVAQLAGAKDATGAALIRGRLEEVRSKDIRPATMLLVRRATHEMGDQKIADAVEDFGAALSLQGDVAVLWRSRAQARLAGGDSSGAVSDLGVSLQHDAEDALSWQTLSAAEEASGDGQAALKAWQRVMELDPQTPGAAKRFEKLRLQAFGRPT